MAGSLRSLCIEFSTRKKVFECPSCPKKFSKPSALKVHTYSHTGEKPHKCQGCDKQFSVLSNLRRHIKTHVKTPHHHKSYVVSRCSPSLQSDPTTRLMVTRQYPILTENSESISSLPSLSSPYSSTYSSNSSSSSSSSLSLGLLTEKPLVSSVNTSASSIPGLFYPTAILTESVVDPVDLVGHLFQENTMQTSESIPTNDGFNVYSDAFFPDSKSHFMNSYRPTQQDIWVNTTLQQLGILPFI